ncbi:MAG TPA: acylphosphatase [Candidatus Peregrinibacteria bacterium]|nr:acylphosphatase [Candidatus Peregrinibacteria bacterium]
MDIINFKVTGIVQGVFFRSNTEKKAQELELFGWVKNDPGNNVSGEAQGEKEALVKFIAWLSEGPDSANVEEVEVTWGKEEQKCQDFSIRY